MKSKLPVFGIVTAILLVFRILLNNNQQLVLVTSLINLVALLMVVYSITVRIKSSLLSKIRQSSVPRNIIEREIKRTYTFVDLFVYIPLTIFYILYLIFLSSELGNDIISIVALGLSLSDSFISDAAINLYKE